MLSALGGKFQGLVVGPAVLDDERGWRAISFLSLVGEGIGSIYFRCSAVTADFVRAPR